MRFFTSTGQLTIGIHKGTPFGKLSDGYLTWACTNIDGFREELDALRGCTAKRDKKSKARQLDIRSACGSGKVKNAGFARPGHKQWVSRGKKPKPSAWQPPVANDHSPRARELAEDPILKYVLPNELHVPPDFEPPTFDPDDAPPW